MTFKEMYDAAKTYGEIDKSIETLSDNAMHEMIGSMMVVASTTGLDMKQEAVLTMLKTAVNRTAELNKCDGCKIKDGAGICIIGGC